MVLLKTGTNLTPFKGILKITENKWVGTLAL